MQWLLTPPDDAAPPATILIRLMAGGVFVGEGSLKFVFPTTLGVGRVHALGIPAPELMATFVGLVELVGGLLFLLGWFTRRPTSRSSSISWWPSSRPKSPSGSGPRRCHRRRPLRRWASGHVIHEIRPDMAQLLCSGFCSSWGPGRGHWTRSWPVGGRERRRVIELEAVAR